MIPARGTADIEQHREDTRRHLVKVALARALPLADGTALDYTIAGADVDCKFSYRRGGWMIPPEADGQLMLLVQASDEDGTWSAACCGPPRRTSAWPGTGTTNGRSTNGAGPRCAGCTPGPAAGERPDQNGRTGRAGGVRLAFWAAAGERAVPARAADAGEPDGGGHGGDAGRLHEAGQGRRRGAGPAARRGHRDLRRLRGRPDAGRRLGLPRPGPGEFVSARLARRDRVAGRRYDRSVRLDGTDWLLACPADPVQPAPALPR